MSFVSGRVLEAERERKKEQKRLARAKILDEAKEKFMKEKQLREQRHQRGDDAWLAPGVNKRLKLPSKNKKHKKSKTKHKSDSPKRHNEEVDDGTEDMWVEKGEESSQQATPLARDEWMTTLIGPSLASTKRLAELTELAKKKSNDDEEEGEGMTREEPGGHPLELNPYWKGGGAGLPQEDDQPVSGRNLVGDGGRSWLLRSYKRALQRAEEEGVSFESIAVHQWGSLDKLHSMLRDARIDPDNPDGPSKSKRNLYVREERERRGPTDRHGNREHRGPTDHHGNRSSSSYRRPYRDERKSSSKHFMKPSLDDEEIPTGSSGQHLLLGMSGTSNWQSKDAPTAPPTLSQNSNDDDDAGYNDEADTVEGDGDTSPPPPPPQSVTLNQLNMTAAKLVKAEIMGDQRKIQELKNEMEHLKMLMETSAGSTEGNRGQRMGREEQVVLLTKTDKYGNARPVNMGHSNRKSNKGYRHTDKGKRKKYFADDDDHTLRSLIEQERSLTAEDTHLAIAQMASKFVPSAQGQEVIDDALDSTSVMKYDHDKEMKRNQSKAKAESLRMTHIMDNCKRCLDNEGFDKHLLIAVGINVYLTLPAVQSLINGHCLLVPMEHKSNSMILDENVWSEMNVYRKGLTRMFSDRDMDVVYMETYTHSKRQGHMCIECIPIPKDVGHLAQMYFKKAIQESDQEWSDNKKLIDTSKKGVRGSLPVGLPYFFVEFGLDGGYAHIIEDHTKFPHYFGKEICGGMMDLDPHLWLKPHRESFERQKEKAVEFAEWWAPYDWTQKLKE
jgi:hypothetical protein